MTLLGRHFFGFRQGHGDQLADAALGHGDAEQPVHARHRQGMVGDDQETGARFLGHVFHHLAEALDIGVVQGRIHFVQHADRGGIDHEDGEDQRQGSEGLFAARQQRQGLQALARRAGEYLQPRFERIFRFGEGEARFPAFEQLGEKLLEIGVHFFKRGQQPFATFLVQALDAPAQTLDGAGEVVAVGGQGAEARFLLGGFFLGAQIDAAKLFAFLLQALDPLFGLIKRRQFLAVLDFGALAQFFRRGVDFVPDAQAQFLDAAGRRFAHGLGAGAFLARGRQDRIGGLGVLVGFGQTAFGFGKGIAGCLARLFRLGDGIQQRDAFVGNFRRDGFSVRQFGAEFALAAAEFGNLLGGGGAARAPALGIARYDGKTVRAHIAFAPEPVERGAGLAAGDAGIGRPAAGFGNFACQGEAVAKFIERGIGLAARFCRGFDGLFQAADFGFQVGELGAALGAGAGGASAFILGRDQYLFGLANIVLGLARRLACRDGGILGAGIDSENFVAAVLGGMKLLIEHRQAVAL